MFLILMKKLILVLILTYLMSQILMPQQPQPSSVTSNMDWLRQGNKYIENQYESKSNWGSNELHRKSTFDNKFINEYSFICNNMD